MIKLSRCSGAGTENLKEVLSEMLFSNEQGQATSAEIMDFCGGPP